MQDNFADLGGDSLLAVQVRVQIQEKLKIQIPVHVFLELPTFDSLVEYVKKEQGASAVSAAAQLGETPQGSTSAGSEPASSKLLISLEAGKAGKSPLCLIHAIGGSVYSYLPLSMSLRNDMPTYGIRASGMEQGEPVYSDIREMAACYLSAITARWPEGPYLLGGYSFGGVIAYEMAQQLHAQGKNVSLVVLLDTPALSSMQSTASLPIADMAQMMTPQPGEAGAISPDFLMALALQSDSSLRNLVMGAYQALRSYVPAPTKTRILYLRAKEQSASAELQAVKEWMQLAHGEFTLEQVPGDHFSMMGPPHIDSVARAIRRAIEQVT